MTATTLEWTALALLCLPVLVRFGRALLRWVLLPSFVLTGALFLAAHEPRLALGPISGAAVCVLVLRWRGAWRLVRRRRPVRIGA